MSEELIYRAELRAVVYNTNDRVGILEVFIYNYYKVENYYTERNSWRIGYLSAKLLLFPVTLFGIFFIFEYIQKHTF